MRHIISFFSLFLCLNVNGQETDAFGNPVDVTGTIFNETKQEIGRFAVVYEGRGVF